MSEDILSLKLYILWLAVPSFLEVYLLLYMAK